MQNTLDFCLGVAHKYLELLYLYLELLMTLLDQIRELLDQIAGNYFFQLWWENPTHLSL